MYNVKQQATSFLTLLYIITERVNIQDGPGMGLSEEWKEKRISWQPTHGTHNLTIRTDIFVSHLHSAEQGSAIAIPYSCPNRSRSWILSTYASQWFCKMNCPALMASFSVSTGSLVFFHLSPRIVVSVYRVIWKAYLLELF